MSNVGDNLQRMQIQLDPIAALYKRRWEQECENSILLAEEVRILSIKASDLEAQLETLQIDAAAPAQEE